MAQKSLNCSPHKTRQHSTLVDYPLGVESQYLRLVNNGGLAFEPKAINLDYPVARFYSQTIHPEYSTAVLSIFALPEPSEIRHLLYTPPDEQQLTVELIP